MTNYRRIGKWAAYAVVASASVILYLVWSGVLLGGMMAVMYVIDSQPSTLYKLAGGDYEFRIIYHPGGGALGPNSELEVTVSGGGWDNETIFKREAVDSVEIVFTDSSRTSVKITRLGRFYWNASDYIWERRDSTIIDLTKTIPLTQPQHASATSLLESVQQRLGIYLGTSPLYSDDKKTQREIRDTT